MRRSTSVNPTAVAAEIATRTSSTGTKRCPSCVAWANETPGLVRPSMREAARIARPVGAPTTIVAKASCNRRGSRARAAANPISRESHAPRLKVKYMEHASTGRAAAAIARVGNPSPRIANPSASRSSDRAEDAEAVPVRDRHGEPVRVDARGTEVPEAVGQHARAERVEGEDADPCRDPADEVRHGRALDDEQRSDDEPCIGNEADRRIQCARHRLRPHRRQREPARKGEDAGDRRQIEEPEREAPLADERDDGDPPREQSSPRPGGGAETPGRAGDEADEQKAEQPDADGREAIENGQRERARPHRDR